MRELRLSAETGQLEPAALALTPDRAWNGSARLSRFIADNLSNILSETHELPAQLGPVPIFANLIPYACPCPCPYAIRVRRRVGENLSRRRECDL